MTKTAIEWTEESWNPIVGCSILSPGCTNCYAMAMAARIEASNAALVAAGKPALAPHYDGTTKLVNGHAVWTGKLGVSKKTLLAPLKRKKPTLYFVNSMGDLFHEDCPDEDIDLVLAVGAMCPQHTLQILTKRAARMHSYMTTPNRKRIIAERVMDASNWLARQGGHQARIKLDDFSACFAGSGPFKNIWLGVSAERQQEWDERKEHLRATPAAVHFASFEPLLGPVVEPQPLSDFLQWAIVGGESGPNARPMHPDWARSLRDQCAAANVPFFFKQWGSWSPTHPDYPNAIPSAVANDGTVYFSPDLAYPDGKRYGEALRAGHDRAHLTSMYNIGKARAGKLLDGRIHQAMPGKFASTAIGE